MEICMPIPLSLSFSIYLYIFNTWSLLALPRPVPHSNSFKFGRHVVHDQFCFSSPFAYHSLFVHCSIIMHTTDFQQNSADSLRVALSYKKYDLPLQIPSSYSKFWYKIVFLQKCNMYRNAMLDILRNVITF